MLIPRAATSTLDVISSGVVDHAQAAEVRVAVHGVPMTGWEVIVLLLGDLLLVLFQALFVVIPQKAFHLINSLAAASIPSNTRTTSIRIWPQVDI